MRGSEGPGRSLSPSPPEHRISRPTSVIRPPGKQIIPQEAIAVNKTLGEGEFGVVQQGLFFANVESSLFRVFLGVILLLAVILNTYIRRIITGER